VTTDRDTDCLSDQERLQNQVAQKQMTWRTRSARASPSPGRSIVPGVGAGSAFLRKFLLFCWGPGVGFPNHREQLTRTLLPGQSCLLGRLGRRRRGARRWVLLPWPQPCHWVNCGSCASAGQAGCISTETQTRDGITG
jgi:hypothetical protein